jgi:alanine racemase
LSVADPEDHDPTAPATVRMAIDLGALAANWRTCASCRATPGAALRSRPTPTAPAPRCRTQAGARRLPGFLSLQTPTKGATPAPASCRTRESTCSTALSRARSRRSGARPHSGDQLTGTGRILDGNADGRPYALHIDTGMNRLGLTPEQAVPSRESRRPAPALVMSHFACADEPAHPLNARQMKIFSRAARLLSWSGNEPRQFGRNPSGQARPP